MLYGTEGTSLLCFVKPALLAVVGCSGMGPCEGHMSRMNSASERKATGSARGAPAGAGPAVPSHPAIFDDSSTRTDDER